MRSEYFPKGKSDPTSLLPWLFVSMCKSAGSVLLFVEVSSWLSVRETGARTGPMFSTPRV
jgi:hypothetical protein